MFFARFIFILISIFVLNTSFAPGVLESGYEQLILFIDSENPILSDGDEEALKGLAKELEMEYYLVDVQEGAPEEVTYTPSIVYQNTAGRSFFYGRYKNLSRLKNFIRTARLVHQEDTDNIKKRILVWKNERATITAPIKVTNLTGERPKQFDQQAFINKATASAFDGMQAFQPQESFNQGRTARAFYFNLYPYLSKEGILSISGEIYSQYNCVEPIFKQFDPPLTSGKWKDWETLFVEAGKGMEAEIKRQITHSTIGDAFHPVASTAPIKSWTALDLSLPTAEKTVEADSPKTVEWSKEWKMDSQRDKAEPIVIFSFLPPLDNYAGEVKEMTGKVSLEEEGKLKGAKGEFAVQIADVTMGDKGFDKEVQNKMLDMMNFPSSSFIFEVVKAEDKSLAIGEGQTIVLKGNFVMKGVTIPLEVPAQVLPKLNKEGNIFLKVKTTYTLSLFEHFKIDGPDGPSPAKDNLRFYMKFDLIE